MSRMDHGKANPYSTKNNGLRRVRPRSDKPDKGDSEKDFDRTVEDIFTRYRQDKGR